MKDKWEQGNIPCFGCGQVFVASVHIWTDPDGKVHKMAPMRCDSCLGKKKKSEKRRWNAMADP
jgi:hypothetical protein